MTELKTQTARPVPPGQELPDTLAKQTHPPITGQSTEGRLSGTGVFSGKFLSLLPTSVLTLNRAANVLSAPLPG